MNIKKIKTTLQSFYQGREKTFFSGLFFAPFVAFALEHNWSHVVHALLVWLFIFAALLMIEKKLSKKN